MEAAASPVALAGPPGDSSAALGHDDDARHCATTASQVPKAASSTILPPSLPLPPAALGDPSNKSGGARANDDVHEAELPRQSLRSSRQYIGKGKEPLTIERETKKPLELLDLPIDVLKDIVKEVTHTNDLTSLALCHSALHRLTIPHIYSRFDIVWPDTSTHAEPRSGVDALTYGLATLVMAEEIFGENVNRPASSGNRYNSGGVGKATETTVRRRRGNHYAQYTRKFSLGNGPVDWVQEYLITKEGGKMLGTLVALAVARMRALETFVWDMPTGILRDVWAALSSLGDRDDGRPCRLEKFWVRFHDNSGAEVVHAIQQMPAPMNVNMVPPPPPQVPALNMPVPQIHLAALDRVEHPSFSILPPLKSLSVVDIDELPYLDEMAVLIGNSQDKLRDLRVGIARHAVTRDWITVWEGDGLRQVDNDSPTMGSLTLGEKRLGGILGILTGFVFDMRNLKSPATQSSHHQQEGQTLRGVPVGQAIDVPLRRTSAEMPALRHVPSHALESLPALADSLPPDGSTDAVELPPDDSIEPSAALQASPIPSSGDLQGPAEPVEGTAGMTADDDMSVETTEDDFPPVAYASNVLHLETLELERVPLSVPVLQNAFDWSMLTSLTLLNCQNHEQLWKTLRRSFVPTPKSPAYPQARRQSSLSPKKNRLSYGGGDVEMVYGLHLKKIHTNTVSPALIAFLKETLAPNSLEVLFLQEARSYSSSVSIDNIFRGPLKRHRNSLKKVLIDSSDKGTDGLPTNSSRWRRWMVTREVLSFMCSGKMPLLKEIGITIDYRDWHFFLQHLPAVPHVRSLYIPFLADHVHGPTADPRELAMQILDIVALRPEVELCYMGIANKCFEILENKRDWDPFSESRMVSGGGMDDVASDADEEDEEDDLDDVDDMDELDVMDETESEEEDDDMDDTDSELDGSIHSKHSARLRLREILFYDDKVAIFKARHGKL